MTSVPHSGAKSVTPGGSVAGGAGHTAGPWAAVLNFEGRDGCPDVWQIDAEYHAICTTQFCYAQETAANARLIAAAPDLLEALILLEAEMVLSGNAGSTDYGWKPAIIKTRAAIAKATAGETRNAEPIHRRDGDEG